jgi:PAS domain S-box-containing protein
VHSERFLRAITDNVPVRLAYFDLHGRLQFVNQTLCARFSQTREQMLGRTLAQVIPERQSPVAERFELAKTGVAQRFEYADEFNGQIRHILTQLIPDKDDHGNVQGVFGVGVDVSAEVTARNEFDRQTAILNAIIEAIPAMVAVWDLDMRCLLVNRAFETWRSTSREDLVGRRLGGDEFAIALPNVPNIEAAARIADKIVSAAQEPVGVGRLTVKVGASVGVALNAQVGDWKQLIARADAMAYEAKATGRGRRAVESTAATG